MGTCELRGRREWVQSWAYSLRNIRFPIFKMALTTQCSVVEDFLTNPYQPCCGPVSPRRMESFRLRGTKNKKKVREMMKIGSRKRTRRRLQELGSNNQNQEMVTLPNIHVTRSSSISSGSSSPFNIRHEKTRNLSIRPPGRQRIRMSKFTLKLSPFYLSSSPLRPSSPPLTTPHFIFPDYTNPYSAISSPSPNSSSPEQFWNQYRRRPRTTSMTGLLRKALM